ncbi:MAG: phosphoribosylglycinamide formyltransferase [Atopobiaceae bacterium]|jgi:phosphoribosylglycinamide formyltransferase-1|nr:phosphoribosylglycinamide formyltransferase [Atopobiaceae bacterium]MCH4181108.1 phosphoribosylglycinamide formyltransferase [Atopobiaceae bacterium]MCH4214093.1 phosphoribosylglycinamide formyltransferase [Atopobiaceae bacterium]MCH4230364.1 phosphoribosylglycinamide formyltransferase [Atopobiaceae bacterium]MCH4276445.1 phosphoribosylglycinamide formyltransferase [Atopobiaceae bacterium]
MSAKRDPALDTSTLDAAEGSDAFESELCSVVGTAAEGDGFTPHSPLRLGVLISGNGTNLQAIIDAIAAGALDAEVALVVSSRPSAFGLKRAEEAGIQTLTLSKETYADPVVADEVIAGELYRAGVDYVIMAGYMRKVGAPLLATFPNRIVNLHPALLPSFPGAHAIAEAYARGVKVTGVTVHFANADYDAGPIIAQRALSVREGWDVDELESHIHDIEHELYPATIQLLAQGRVHVRADGTVEVASA